MSTLSNQSAISQNLGFPIRGVSLFHFDDTMPDDLSDYDQTQFEHRLQLSHDHRQQLWDLFADSYHRKSYGPAIWAAKPGPENFIEAALHTRELIAEGKTHAILAPSFLFSNEDDPLLQIGYQAGALVRRQDGTYTLVNLLSTTNPYDSRSRRISATGNMVTSAKKLKRGLVRDLALGVYIAGQTAPITKAGFTHLSASIYGDQDASPITEWQWVHAWPDVQKIIEHAHDHAAAIHKGFIEEQQSQIKDTTNDELPTQSELTPNPCSIDVLYDKRARARAFETLKNLGISDLRDIPDDFNSKHPEAKLNGIHLRQIRAAKTGKVAVHNASGLRQELMFLSDTQSKSEHISCFDVETITPAVALIKGSRHGQRICPQFSNHRLGGRKNEVAHNEFLWTGDPESPGALKKLTQDIADAIIKSLGGSSAILVWNESFERSVLRDIALLLRDYGDTDRAKKIESLTYERSVLELVNELEGQGHHERARQIKDAMRSKSYLTKFMEVLQKNARKDTLKGNLDYVILGRLQDAMEQDDRIIDLLEIYKNHVYHPNQGASFKIKDVIAALHPEESYKKLIGIQKGDEAMASLEERYHANTIASRIKEIDENALRYCKHDTYVMVLILKFLFDQAGLSWPYGPISPSQN